jgi:prepilin-type N-terminal cleavage/methylation domain-containing protein
MSVARRDERGFTLPEVLVVIAILGILLAIGIIIWLGILEQRRVDAAINQLTADMRLAHTRATNQLVPWRVILAPGNPNYELRKMTSPPETVQRSLPEGTKLFSTTADPSSPTPFIEFNPDGTLYVVSGPNGNVTVSSAAADEDPKRRATYFSATSRIRVDP